MEHREELKFIQSLDKSRSGRNVIPRIIKSTPKNDRFSYLGSNYLEIINILNQQSKSKNKNKEKHEKGEKSEKNSPKKIKEEDTPEIDNATANINETNSDLRSKEVKSTKISANKRNINKNNIKIKK